MRRFFPKGLGLVLLLSLLSLACLSPLALMREWRLQRDWQATLEGMVAQDPPSSFLVVTPEAAETEVRASPALQAVAPDLEGLLVDLYQRVSPGVVAIRVYGGQGPSMDVPMDFEFPTGQGSGFVYDKAGHIVTNYHVVADGEKFEVVFSNGDKAWAEIVGLDQGSDLAVLQVQDVPENELVPLPVGDSDQVKPGQLVVALGNPFGLRGTMTLGIVSARGRTLPSEQAARQGGVFSMGDLIQTDAAINPGNSGGPLLNLQGEVIGVNRAIRTEGLVRANVGVGFAIASNWVRIVVPELIRTGEFVYPYLGIQARDDLPLSAIEKLDLPVDYGVYVIEVVPGSPADRAGLRGAETTESPHVIPSGGDLIVAINERPVYTFDDLISYLVTKVRPGDTVTLTIYRDGKTMEVEVTVGSR